MCSGKAQQRFVVFPPLFLDWSMYRESYVRTVRLAASSFSVVSGVDLSQRLFISELNVLSPVPSLTCATISLPPPSLSIISARYL